MYKVFINKYTIVGVILLGLFLTIFVLYNKINSLLEKYSIAVNNEKATAHQNRVYKLTIELLLYLGDSITLELDSVRKALKIKDNNLISMQLIEEVITKPTHDTLTLKDTIFVKNLKIDTIIGDKDYNLHLYLAYPDTIITKPTFNNKKDIFISSRKETINAPKKFFLLRWFQKKQTIAIVDIVDTNPYVLNKSQRYIQILNKNNK